MDDDNVRYTKPDDNGSMHSSLLDMRFSRSKRTRNEKILAAIVVVLFILWIVFMALFIHEKQNKCDSMSGDSSAEKGDSNTTVEPTTIAPTEPDYGNGPWESIRLPKYFKPSHYDILLKIDIKKLVFSGNVTVNVTLTNVSDYMYLHVNKLNITSPKLLQGASLLPLSRNFWYKKNEFYVLDPVEKLAKGEYQIKMDFMGILDNDLKGLYRSSYKNKSGVVITMATTQLQPTDARKVFPCFDEPSYKATFQVTIVRPKDLISITNTPKINSGPEEDGMIADKYQRTVIMSTYLLAFVVCDYKYVQTYAGQRNTSMKYYVAEEQLDQTELAAEIGGKILAKFENYFNISYPLAKADMIAIPDFAAGAMENWGLITYRETAMLYKDGQSSERNKQRITAVIAHELAHMWFGNLVTTEWWDDLWLNEGFASYVEYIGVDHVFPTWQMKDYFVIADMKSAFSLDALVTSHPILVPVNHPDEINEIFDSISYNKGATVLRMLQYFLTENVFRTGLTNYLNLHKYGNAKTKDLWNSLSNASKDAGKVIDVAMIMDTWTLQMGFPVVNVTNDGTDIVLTQQRFLSDPHANLSNTKFVSTYGYKWHIPFTIDVRDSKTNKTIPTDATSITWMKPKNDKTKVNDTKWNSANQWVKGNIGQTGFYRVNYPVENWKLLAEQLKHDHKVLSVADRAGLIQDAFALTDATLLEYKYALNLTQYINKEQDYIPWRAAYDSIASLYSLLPRSSRVRTGLQQYLFMKTMPALDRLGFVDNGTHLEKYMRVDAIDAACSNKNETCLEKMKNYFDAWIENETANPVPANLRTLVYFYGMSQSGQKEWDITFERLQNSNIASERRKLMYGLAGINEPWLIIRYLQYTFDTTKIKAQDASAVISYVAHANPIGRYFAWNHLKEMWPVVLKTYGGGFGFVMNRFLTGVAAPFSTQWELDQVQALYTKYPESGSGTRAREQLLERIRSNIDWRKANEKVLEEWLDDNNI